MKRLSVISLAMALLASTLPSSAQDPIPFNEMARASNASFSFVDSRADYDGQAASSTQSPHQHWSHRGRVLTYIGIPLLAVGGITMGAALHHGCQPNDFACVGDDLEKIMGGSLMAAGGTLTIVGATRRTTE